MWNESQIVRWLDESPSHCALLLAGIADGKWIVQQMREDGCLPCRIAQNKKSALHSMSALFHKTAKNTQKPTVAFAGDVWDAAMLAGQVGGAVTFDTLDPALGTLALLYCGSLRVSPPV